jgi:type IV pilus assembly protein PilE
MNIRHWCRHRAGFVLLEILVVIAIIGLLLTLMLPSYQKHILQSYRLEASAELLKLANQQQLLFAEQGRYTEDLAELGYPQTSYLTESGRYLISAKLTDDGFQVFADVAGAQQADIDCQQFQLAHTGIKTSEPETGCWQSL